jgi:CxxC motif-containing protein (DUF1111 family)
MKWSLFLIVLFQGCLFQENKNINNSKLGLLEENEVLSGGDATVQSNTINAFSLPISRMTSESETKFAIGNSLFKKNWVASPASTTARDGLGPTFNAKSCSACHFLDGRAEPFFQGEALVQPLLRLAVMGANGAEPHPVYGRQLQTQSIKGVLPEAKAIIAYEEVLGSFADGSTYSLQKPVYKIIEENFGDIGVDIMISPRIGQAVMGLGLLEAIPAETILLHEDPNDTNQDGITGKANWVKDENGKLVIGRLGWKANTANVFSQAIDAAFHDIGLTSKRLKGVNCSEKQVDCLEAPNGGEEELEENQVEKLVFYLRTLGVPARRNFSEENVRRGKKVFQEISCAACHIPRFKTGNAAVVPQLKNQTIYPYTDLLLHDMGEGLADNTPDGLANGREWKTPPLWGIGLVESVNKHTRFLHDGRARNMEEAVLWHGGEAKASKDKYTQLDVDDRLALLAFLKSL